MPMLLQPQHPPGATRSLPCAGWRIPALALVGLALAGQVRCRAEPAAAPFREYEVKAVFLFNFTQFVDWPPSAFTDDAAPLVITVLGNDPFGPLLEQTVQGETMKGRALVVRRCRRVEDVGPCHLLYISSSENARLPAIFKRLQDRAVLTVGDADAFAAAGGMIRFTRAQSRVQFDINVAAAQRAGLSVSAKLLKVARVTGPERLAGRR